MASDIPIWPGAAPGAPTPLPPQEITARDGGGTNATSVAVPGFAVHRPARPNGHGLVLCQGGGYQRVGRVPIIPDWFAEQGFVVFDLAYRLPGQGWAAGPDVALEDAQQAMRLIRRRANEFDVTGVVGVAGFSSGGHVASSLATRFDEPHATSEAEAGFPARPDFALLMCPVVTMLGAQSHEGSRVQMFGAEREETELAKRSAERRVTEMTPPTLLVHAADDPVVPVANSVQMFAALKAKGVPAQLHVFETGGHIMSQGFRPDTPLTPYPDLILKWLATRFDIGAAEVAQ